MKEKRLETAGPNQSATKTREKGTINFIASFESVKILGEEGFGKGRTVL